MTDRPKSQHPPAAATPRVRAVHIRKTKLYFEGADTVAAYREVVLFGQKLLEFWMPICRDGVPYAKPEPLVEGRDFWSDWDRLAKQAQKKLRDAARDPSRPRPTAEEFKVRKGSVACFIGSRPPADAEITKKLIISDD
jgi:hypothetical protein